MLMYLYPQYLCAEHKRRKSRLNSWKNIKPVHSTHKLSRPGLETKVKYCDISDYVTNQSWKLQVSIKTYSSSLLDEDDFELDDFKFFDSDEDEL